MYAPCAIEDLCSLLLSSSSRSSNEDARYDSFQPSEQQILGEFEALHLQSNQDPAGLTALLEDWFTIEDSEIVKLDEIEMILEATTCTTEDQEHQNDPASPTPGSEDLESDSGAQSADLEPSCEQSHKDVLNIEKSMHGLLHITSLLSEDDTSSLLTKVYHIIMS